MALEGSDWVSASELGDYVFCPRSHWYSRHEPDRPVPRSSQRREAAGRAFHDDALGGVRRRSERRGAYVALLLLAVLLCVVAGYLRF